MEVSSLNWTEGRFYTEIVLETRWIITDRYRWMLFWLRCEKSTSYATITVEVTHPGTEAHWCCFTSSIDFKPFSNWYSCKVEVKASTIIRIPICHHYTSQDQNMHAVLISSIGHLTIPSTIKKKSNWLWSYYDVC